MTTDLQPEGDELSVILNIDGDLLKAVLSEDCNALYTPGLINSTSTIMAQDEGDADKVYYSTEIADILTICTWFSMMKQKDEEPVPIGPRWQQQPNPDSFIGVSLVLETDAGQEPDNSLFMVWLGAEGATSASIEEQRERHIERSVEREEHDEAIDWVWTEDNSTQIL